MHYGLMVQSKLLCLMQASIELRGRSSHHHLRAYRLLSCEMLLQLLIVAEVAIVMNANVTKLNFSLELT